MSTTISPVSSASGSANRVPAQMANAPSQVASRPDGLAFAQTSSAPLLTIGAAALAQLVPGVIEAEGATAIATTIGIGARAAMANPAIRIAAGIAGTEALGYANTLVHDAFNGQPGSQFFAKIANTIDTSVHIGLGIPQSVDR